MAQHPEITDRATLQRHRAKAHVRFLHDAVALDLQERLNEVNKQFTNPAIVTGLPQFWNDFQRAALIVPDDDVLALQPGVHDLVVHALSLHWANDPVGQLVQCRRALAPGGLFLGALFGGQTLTEMRISLAEAESSLTGGLSPRVLPMGEIRDLGGLLQRAGYAMPVADSTTYEVRYKTPRALMHDLRLMGEGNALAARHRHFSTRRLFAEAEQRYRTNFHDGDGVRASFDVIFLTGWSPQDEKPKDLPAAQTGR